MPVLQLGFGWVGTKGQSIVGSHSQLPHGCQILMLSSDEHQRRSPDCMFFSLARSTQPRPAGIKRDRTSKASRMSTQSSFTSISEAPSLAEIGVEEGDGALTTATDATTTSTVPRAGKKAGRPRKITAKGKKSAITQALEAAHASSFNEPEDDDFEVKVEALPSKSTHGKKRTSDEMDVDPPAHFQGAASDAALTHTPPTKRRATRSRSTLSQAHITPTELRYAEQDLDAPMTDAENMPPPQVITSKKGGKGGKMRTSSSARIVSNASTASMAPLRAAVPADDEIDADLEAELDRPLTDDEPELEERDVEKPKTRRLTRTRPGSKKATASVAPVRKTRASTLIIDYAGSTEEQTDGIPAVEYPAGVVSATETHSESEARPIGEALAVSKIKPAKGKANRKASASQRHTAKKDNMENSHKAYQGDDVDLAEEVVQAPGESLALGLPSPQAITKSLRSQQTSRQLPAQGARASELSTSDHVVNSVMDMDSSTITARTAGDDSGHETDSRTASRASSNKAGGKATGARKKGRSGKKSATMSRNIEQIIQQPTPTLDTQKPEDEEVDNEHRVAEFQPFNPVEGAVELPSVEPAIIPLMDDPPAKEPKAKKRAAKPTKTKAGKPKPGAEAADAPAQSLDETKNTPPQDTQPAKQASPAVEFSNPTPPLTQKPTAIVALSPPQPQSTSPPPPSPHPATPSPSPQASDAENQPPSARHSITHSALSTLSTSKGQETRIPLAASTPTSNRNIPASRLQSTFPWTAVDLETVFNTDSPGKENIVLQNVIKEGLMSPEKRMSVEEWIQWNAVKGEERLRGKCERLVGRFEGQGVRALRALEGIVDVDE